MLDVCLLGTGGMTPMPKRWLTSLLLRCEGSNLLIDCGEGTQIAMKKVGWSPKPIDIICFTHFHADHIAGLPGLLHFMANSGRTEPLTFIGPKGLINIVRGLRVIAPDLPFDMSFIELDQNTEEYHIGPYTIGAFRVKHNMVCYGYTVTVKRGRRFDPEAAKAQNIPLEYWSVLQKGKNARNDKTGELYTPDMVLGPERRPIRVTYTTDTRPCDNIVRAASDTDLFICEGMYGEPDSDEKARIHRHMTMQEAAYIAKEAAIPPKEMWLTHYSPSMVNPQMYMDEICSIFPDAVAGKDGMTVELSFTED